MDVPDIRVRLVPEVAMSALVAGNKSVDHGGRCAGNLGYPAAVPQ